MRGEEGGRGVAGAEIETGSRGRKTRHHHHHHHRSEERKEAAEPLPSWRRDPSSDRREWSVLWIWHGMIHSLSPRVEKGGKNGRW